jgi:hypothetical protein
MKKIKNFENYSIDEEGNVYNSKGKLRKVNINSGGYKYIHLSKNGKLYLRFIHKLIYQTYVGEINDDMTIDHIDNNKLNNSITNLQQLSKYDNWNKWNNKRHNHINVDGYVKVKGFEDYSINKNGDVISFKYGDDFHTLKYNEKYKFVKLRKDNKTYKRTKKTLIKENFSNN